MELMGPYLIACALLVAAGLAKALRPKDTARALASLLHLPLAVLVPAVRFGALAEAALGAYSLLEPRWWTAGAVAASYLSFTVVVLVARAQGGPLATCGCFGTPDTPATVLHAVLNALLAVSALVVALALPGTSLASWLGHQPGDGLPLLLASAIGTYLTYLAMSGMARLEAARRLTRVQHRIHKEAAR